MGLMNYKYSFSIGQNHLCFPVTMYHVPAINWTIP